jgi:hypothetical protein
MVREHFYLKEVMEIYFADYNEVQIVMQKKSCSSHVYYPLEFCICFSPHGLLYWIQTYYVIYTGLGFMCLWT